MNGAIMTGKHKILQQDLCKPQNCCGVTGDSNMDSDVISEMCKNQERKILGKN
jgi:hypothetical protein